ncbi:MAG: DUF2283 domain-containing protein [Nanoarchaeota archaeon]
MIKNKKKSKIDYDFNNDNLFVYPKKREPNEYQFSEYVDNIIFDFDKKNKLIGIEILDASKTLNLSRYKLSFLDKWNFEVIINQEIIKIKINLKFQVRNKINKNSIYIEKLNGSILNSVHMNLAFS